jgi:hypothetical protein
MKFSLTCGYTSNNLLYRFRLILIALTPVAGLDIARLYGYIHSTDHLKAIARDPQTTTNSHIKLVQGSSPVSFMILPHNSLNSSPTDSLHTLHASFLNF